MRCKEARCLYACASVGLMLGRMSCSLSCGPGKWRPPNRKWHVGGGIVPKRRSAQSAGQMRRSSSLIKRRTTTMVLEGDSVVSRLACEADTGHKVYTGHHMNTVLACDASRPDEDSDLLPYMLLQAPHPRNSHLRICLSLSYTSHWHASRTGQQQNGPILCCMSAKAYDTVPSCHCLR